MSIIIFIICICTVFNPQHDRELITPVLLSGWACFQKFKGFPKNIAFYAVVLFGAVITLSYFTTVGSSINYRPLLFLYIGIGTYIIVTLFLDYNIKILRWIYYGAIVTSVWYVIHYWTNGFYGFNPIFMHKNVGGLFWAMSLMIYKPYRWEWFGIPVVVLALLLSSSRGAAGALILVGLIYIVIKKKWKYIAPLVLLIGLVVLFQGKRFNFKDITHGRTNITWPKMWKLIKEKPLLGQGIGNMHVNSLPNNVGPHNLYIFLHGAGGILALLLFFIPYLTAMKSKAKLNLKMSASIYLIYSFFSECAANTPPNQIIYWFLIGLMNEEEVFFIMPHYKNIIKRWKKCSE